MSKDPTLDRASAAAYVTRRLAWDKAVIAMPHRCPNCGEEHQVQIRDTTDGGGPLWKCRMCKHRFHTPKPKGTPEP